MCVSVWKKFSSFNWTHSASPKNFHPPSKPIFGSQRAKININHRQPGCCCLRDRDVWFLLQRNWLPRLQQMNFEHENVHCATVKTDHLIFRWNAMPGRRYELLSSRLEAWKNSNKNVVRHCLPLVFTMPRQMTNAEHRRAIKMLECLIFSYPFELFRVGRKTRAFFAWGRTSCSMSSSEFYRTRGFDFVGDSESRV